MLNSIVYFIFLGMAIGTASYIIAHAEVSYPFRHWLDTHYVATESKKWLWIANLFSCPLCVGVWLAFGATAIYGPMWAYDPAWRIPFDFMANSFALQPISLVTVFVIKLGLRSQTYQKAMQELGY